MKKLLLSLLALIGTLTINGAAQASDVMVASAMQRCTTNEECTLITNSCADNCGFVPVNKLNLTTLQGVYQSRCGKPMEANPQCNINPPIAAACINSRCTIDYAYANHAGAKDYKAGAYPVSEAPVPSKAPASSAPANDRQGFTAYNLPNQDVRQSSLGEIRTTIYVPPSAPVSGGNYVPVGQQPQTAAPAVPAPAPTAPTPTPVAPKAMAVPYKPAAATYATPPVMNSAAPVVLQPQAAPPGTTPIDPVPQPTATTTPNTKATPANPIPSSAPERILEPRTPQLDPLVKGVSPDTGNINVPIPPSDFKEKSLVPPPGSTSLVAPEDPGAKPDANMILQSPVPRGPDDAPMFKVKTTPNSSGTGANE